jgi:hypothetical protein
MIVKVSITKFEWTIILIGNFLYLVLMCTHIHKILIGTIILPILFPKDDCHFLYIFLLMIIIYDTKGIPLIFLLGNASSKLEIISPHFFFYSNDDKCLNYQ